MGRSEGTADEISGALVSVRRMAQLPTVAGTTRTLNLLTLAGIYGLFGGVVGSWVQLAGEGASYDHPFLRGWGLAGACAAVGRVAVHRLLRGTGLPAGMLGWGAGAVIAVVMLAVQGATLHRAVDATTVLAAVVAALAALAVERVFAPRPDAVHHAWQGAAMTGFLAVLGIGGLALRSMDGQVPTSTETYVVLVATLASAIAAVVVDDRSRRRDGAEPTITHK